MKRIILILIFVLCYLTHFGQQTGTFTETRDGKVYKTVRIGNQTWFAENLNVSHYRNGDSIPEVKTNEAWTEYGNKGMGAWCYYNNDSDNGKIYGKLYNWFAINDSRGLAPKGWHVSSYKEWKKLIGDSTFSEVSGGKLKATTGWNLPNTGATNTSGFSGLPGGSMRQDGPWGIGEWGIWWASTDQKSLSIESAHAFYIENKWSGISTDLDDKAYGFSVRCVKN